PNHIRHPYPTRRSSDLDPELEVSGETPARREQLRQRERARALVAGREPDGDDGHEHEQRARKGEDHELERRVDATRAAPDADDEDRKSTRLNSSHQIIS